MKIPQLTYSDDQDNRVVRSTSVHLGKVELKISAATVTGRDSRANQDAFCFIKDDHRLLAAVFDGAISREASHVTKSNFEIARPQSAREMLVKLNDALASVDLDGGASTATIVELGLEHDRAWLDIAHICDSWAMVEYKDERTELLAIDQHINFDLKILKTMFDTAAKQNLSLTEARYDPHVEQAMQTTFKRIRNAPDGSGEGVLNGSPDMVRYIQTLETKLDLSTIKSIIIGSDGAQYPYDALTDADARHRFFSGIKKLGVMGVIDDIFEDEALHPPTPDHPRWSTHDDKTLIYIEII